MFRKNILAVVCVILFTLMTLGCGGEGAGSLASQDVAKNPTSTLVSNEPVSISGTVYVIDGGQFSQLNNPPTLMARILSFIVPDSVADFTGLTPLTTGQVELFRLASDGTIQASLGTADITGNTYTFATSLVPSSTLMVSVVGATPTMRAFVTGAVVDITPTTEVVVDAVLTSLPTSLVPLENYDVREITAMMDVVTGREVPTGATYAATVTAVGTDAAVTLDNLIAGFAGLATIEETFGLETDASGGYTLSEHSIQLADPAGPATAFSIDASDPASDAGYAGPTHGILLRGTQNGGFSVDPDGEGVSAGRLYPMATDLTDFAVSFDLRDDQYNGGTHDGPVTWNEEYNFFSVTPAPNGQIVFNTAGGRTVVGFTTADKQIVVLPLDKTIGTTQEIRGVQVMTKRFEIFPVTSLNSTYNHDLAIAEVEGNYGMVEYLHKHNDGLVYIESAYANAVSFNGTAQDSLTNDALTRVGLATRTGTYPYNGVAWDQNFGGRDAVCATTLYCLTSGSYTLAQSNHLSNEGGAGLQYSVNNNGQVQIWDVDNHIGEGGMTPDKQVIIVPVNPYFGPSGASAAGPNLRGYLVFGKEIAVAASQLAGTYNIVGEHTYHTDLGDSGEPEFQYGDRYGTLILDGAGNITGGEFFNSTSKLNITAMMASVGTIVTAANTREEVSGTYELSPTIPGGITITSLVVNTVDTSGVITKTVTMTGSGFVVKNGDFMTLQLGGADQGTTNKAERSIMYLGKQF